MQPGLLGSGEGDDAGVDVVAVDANVAYHAADVPIAHVGNVYAVGIVFPVR